jgi:hypothetical protein
LQCQEDHVYFVLNDKPLALSFHLAQASLGIFELFFEAISLFFEPA